MDNFIRKLIFWSVVFITIPMIIAIVLFIWVISTIMVMCVKSLSWFNDKQRAYRINDMLRERRKRFYK